MSEQPDPDDAADVPPEETPDEPTQTVKVAVGSGTLRLSQVYESGLLLLIF